MIYISTVLEVTIMKMAWKEIIKNKSRFIILVSIVFLVSLLTFIISGLSEGLSQDNAALIKDMPEGTFYMNEDAEETYNLSKIDEDTVEKVHEEHHDATPFSIQMGFADDVNDKQLSVAFVASDESDLFPDVDNGEIMLDESLKEKGVKQGDTLKSDQLEDDFTVKGFGDQQKFSHSPVAFISQDNYQEMCHTADTELIVIPDPDLSFSSAALPRVSNKACRDTSPSYSAGHLSLHMSVGVLVVIGGMLVGIFFYMMNVQKIGLYGILKAIGVTTMTL